MQMRPEIQITSVIKTMRDAVIPAIDPANKFAVEQSQLIIGILSLMASQLPVQFHFDRDELARLLACTKAMKEVTAVDTITKGAMGRLAKSSAMAAEVLDGCKIDPTSLVASVRDLRDAIASVVSAVADTDNIDAQLQVEKIILEMSKEQLIRDRSLLKMQGWGPDAAALPGIEELLAQSTCRGLLSQAALNILRRPQ